MESENDIKSLKYTIWIEAEECAPGGWNFLDGNTDAIIHFENNTKYVGSFYTYSNIITLSKKNQSTGECLNGKYLWGTDMILVDEISRKRIEEVIQHLIDEDEFIQVFSDCKMINFDEE